MDVGIHCKWTSVPSDLLSDRVHQVPLLQMVDDGHSGAGSYHQKHLASEPLDRLDRAAVVLRVLELDWRGSDLLQLSLPLRSVKSDILQI